MSNIDLTKEEYARYARHITIPEFGVEGQKKLKAAKILVVGTGGLGSPVLLYLTAAGVGTIGIVDFDVVDRSNLQRQILFDERDIGKKKVRAAKERLNALNPQVNIIVHETMLTSDNALEIIKDYDLVADGTDNFPTRYLVNDACVLLGKTNVYASIFRFEGQVSVFNYTNNAGELGPNYRDLFPEPPPPGLVPNCAEGGVLGVLPGIIGSLQASEVIKVITGVGEPLSGRLFLLDAASFTTRTLKVKRSKDNPLNGENPTQSKLIDYQQFCGILDDKESDQAVKEIDVHELKQLLTEGSEFQLVDVREPHEYEIANLEGELIPLGTIKEQSDRIARDKKVVIHCKSGRRSAKAIEQLQELYALDNLYNLKGGILAYAKEVDESIQAY